MDREKVKPLPGPEFKLPAITSAHAPRAAEVAFWPEIFASPGGKDFGLCTKPDTSICVIRLSGRFLPRPKSLGEPIE
jgi:hypothetical protein